MRAGGKFGPKLTEDDRRELLQLFRDGTPVNEIATAFGVDTSTVRYHTMRAGLSTPKSGAEEQPDLELEIDGFRWESWMTNARCGEVDPDLWFPDKGGSTREAKRICRGCDVRLACLSYALDYDEPFGIWGGKSERERRRIDPFISPLRQESA